MSKIPEDLTLVRINKKTYNKFKDFCDDRGLLAPKQISFLLEGVLENKMNFELIKAGWNIIGERKTLEKEKHYMPNNGDLSSKYAPEVEDEIEI